MAGDEVKKNSTGRTGNRNKNRGAKPITDDRFASAQTDPRFLDAPKKRSKVAIDSRFNRIFTDSRFSTSNAPVDKRGKPNRNDKNNKGAASLKHYYRQEDEKAVEKDVEKETEETDTHTDDDEDENTTSEKIGVQSESESEELEDEDESEDESESSSDTDTDTDGLSVDEGEEEDTFMQPAENITMIDEATRRLAVVNLDWSQVRAVDLYVLFSSFLPKGGEIKSVAVYPTEFGVQRMEEEAVSGPVGLFDDEKKKNDDSDDDEDDDDDEIDKKKLRAYELSRLRYYCAVVECDSSSTANHLYENCDGAEFERSANKLDLRFIPDSMDMKHQPRDVATEAPTNYEGLDFQTRALQHSNINLTWDEDEPQRMKTLNRKLNDKQLDELELKEFLASDESETDDDDDDNDDDDDTEDRSMKKCKRRDIYRALIQSGDGSDEDHDEDNDQDMEVTFNPGLENISKRISEKKDQKSETIWDGILRKRQEKKKASKSGSKYSSEDESSDTDQEHEEQPDDFFVEEPAETESKKKPSVRSNKKGNSGQETTQEGEASRAELELILADDKGADANLKGYNLKPKKIKGKKGKTISDEGKIPNVEFEDSRFSDIFTSPLFALDPTDPQFKRSAVYARQVMQKEKVGGREKVRQIDQSEIPAQESLPKGDDATSDGLRQKKEKSELSSLVRSVKMNAKQVHVPFQVKKRRNYEDLLNKTKKQK